MKLKILIVFLLIFISLGAKAQDIPIDLGYPAVDQMELKIFGAAYPQDNIYNRLNRLEKRVFGTVSNAHLSARVDKLREYVLNEHIPKVVNSSVSPNTRVYRGTQSLDTSQEQSLIVYELEKKLLGSVYINEPINTRLSRLENYVFASSSDNYPTEERLQRLIAYSDAVEDEDYYNDQDQLRQYNKMATGMKVISVLFMILQAFLL